MRSREGMETPERARSRIDPMERIADALERIADSLEADWRPETVEDAVTEEREGGA